MRRSERVAREAVGQQRQLLEQLRQADAMADESTELRSLQRTVGQQQRLRTVGLIAAGVAHDFNNILTSISGYAELLQVGGDRLTDEKRARFLSQLRAAVDRGARLVRQLNVYSRAERPRLARTDLGEALERTARLLQAGAAPGIRIATDLGTGAMDSRIDPAAFEQAVTNLAFNAMEAMDDHGVIELTLGEFDPDEERCTSCLRPIRGARSLIRVADQGPGIRGNPSDLFTPFATGRTDGSRSGLGLSVVHGIVHQHGGHLLMRNRSGGGCEVDLLLPKSSLTSEANPITRERVLWVRPESNDQPQQDIAGLGAHYTIDQAGTANAALASFVDYHAQLRLVVLDSPTQLHRWLDLAIDLHNVNPTVPLLVLDYEGETQSRDKDKVAGLIEQLGEVTLGYPSRPGWSLAAAVTKLLEPKSTRSDLKPVLAAWRSSR